MLPERVVGSGEVALWRAVLDQAMQDACAEPRAMPNPDDPGEARDWLWRSGPDFARVCDGAGLDRKAVTAYAKDVVDGGGRRRRGRRMVG